MNLWKRKLAAFLHDPPSKALDIRTHGDRSDSAFRQAGFIDQEVGDYFQGADHTAAAADRLPFPHWRASNLQCAFDGIRNAFIHPLGGADGKPSRLLFHAEFKSVVEGIEGERSIQPVLSDQSLKKFTNEDQSWRARFFAHWRLWPKHSAELDYRSALLPADTRIPDHSIWTHMQVVSALDGCVGEDNVIRPAFLKFQLGPVQDFIAAARSIRDLWSGSYLLSWLMAAGLKALSAEVGPDAVVFPNMRGQPLFDLHWRRDLWAEVSMGGQNSVWESLAWQNHDLLTPNLPNVFLAVVPADRAADLGRKVAEAIQEEWKKIAQAVWTECERAGLTADEGAISQADRKCRFDTQIARFLSLTWQATPWPESLEDALKLADGFEPDMPIQKARERVQAVVEMATQQMPPEHRDDRYYLGGKEGPKTQLNNIGLGWSIIIAFNSWALDAVRQTRDFTAANTGGWQTGTFNNKDALTGRDEAVAGGDTWAGRAKSLGGSWPSLFKHDDWLAAAILVKRCWHLSYLGASPWNLDADSENFPMPNTRGIAAHDPFAKDKDFNDEEESDDVEELPPSEKYFAVLALDGDEIGKWVSGEKTPPIGAQLADYQDGSKTQRFGSKPYFEKHQFGDFLKKRRPLSPSYHLQFSEALSNFALICACPIVEAFDGRLIFAGGDDVVALLPSDTVLACAQALRAAFTGRQVKAANGDILFHSPAPGFLSSDMRKDEHGRGRPIPFMVPGPAADVSVGIAIAHFKSPLQDVVRAAQAAEKRAKRQLGRSAVAITLYKRSGETVEWGTQWDSHGLEIYHRMAQALEDGEVSSRFPYRVVALLETYLTAAGPLSAKAFERVADFRAADVIEHELAHIIDRQGTSKKAKSALHLEWLEPRGESTIPSLLRLFLHWVTEQEARAAARKLAEQLTALPAGNGPTVKTLRDLAETPIRDDSTHAETFKKQVADLAGTGSEPICRLTTNALESFEKRLPQAQLHAIIGLCQTVAFAHRTRTKDDSQPTEDQSPTLSPAERQLA